MNPTAASNENQGEQVSEWVDAPEDSHVAGFQFIDRSMSEFGANSVIVVTFKGGGKNHKPPATYHYSSSKHNYMKSVFEALKGSAHPGAVIDSMLKKANIPYVGPV